MITPQQIREANNSFPSEVQRTYNAAADRIEVLEADNAGLAKELADERELSAAYEHENSKLWVFINRISEELPPTSEVFHKLKQILDEQS